MSTIRIHLFGKLSVESSQRVIPGLDSRKVQELLCYVLLYRDRPHARETLATLLWGEASTAQAKAYLRKALWQLQSVLEPPADPAPAKILLADHDWIRINPDADLWLDVGIFQHTFQGVQGIPGEQLDRSAADAAQQAVDLYQGDLLDGWYQDWCVYEREQYQNAYLALLDKLMGYHEAQQQYERGLLYGAQILRHDRAREQTHRRLMRLHVLAGDRTAALRQFEQCASSLQEELGVNPSPYTVALLHQIKTNRFGSGTPQLNLLSDSGGPRSDVAIELTDLLARLRRLHDGVAEFQSHVRREIQAFEQTLANLH